MDTAKIELMIKMEEREVVVIDMEVVLGQHDMMEEAIGRGQLLMTGLGGEGDHCPWSVTEYFDFLNNFC